MNLSKDKRSANLDEGFRSVFAAADALMRKYPDGWSLEAVLYPDASLAAWSAELEIVFSPGEVATAWGEGSTPVDALDDLARKVVTKKPADVPIDPGRANDSFAALWQRVERALPERWHLSVWGPSRMYDQPYIADAVGPSSGTKIRGMGFTPYQALAQLNVFLRAQLETS